MNREARMARDLAILNAGRGAAPTGSALQGAARGRIMSTGLTVDLSRLPRSRQRTARRLVSALAFHRHPDVDFPGDRLLVERQLRALGLDPEYIGDGFRLVLEC